MNGDRGRFDRPSGLTGKPKTNRLSRSFRPTPQTQTAAEVDPVTSHQADFKTPTRIPSRSRASGGFSGESPHNESDFQQDIIWDATSPSPRKLGKRVKKHRAGVVDIAEIVSRIAPEHGRPKVVEPTLQQWIGDSAAIPCTPDVQLPKKKSPRPNAVDDLLKLAKQFDFNMFHQDEEVVEDMHQQSLELLSEDILDFENRDLNASFLPPGKCEAAVDVESDVHQDQLMEDDLDLLFDGPTQRMSGSFSQVSSAQPSQVKPTPAAAVGEVSGKKPASIHGSTSGVSKPTPADFDFEDDWDNDDLLDDSLLIEMTQNPQNFTSPKLCSTQKPPCEGKYQKDTDVMNQSAAFKVEKESNRQRTTFKLGSNPNFSVTRIQTDTNSKVGFGVNAADKDDQQSRFSFVSVEKAAQCSWQTRHLNTVKTDPQKQQFSQKTPAANNTSALKTTQNFTNTLRVNAANNMLATKKTLQNFTSKPAVNMSHVSALKTTQNFTNKFTSNISDIRMTQTFTNQPAVNVSSASDSLKPALPDAAGVVPSHTDFLDDDLDSLFSSEPVWDDPADDDLLCELCEELENQIQNAGNLSTKQTPPVYQRPALQPSNKTWDNRNQQPASRQQPFPLKQPPGGPAGVSLAAAPYASCNAAGVQMNAVKDSFRSGSAGLHGGSRIQSAAPRGNPARDQCTFKKPNNPDSTGRNQVVGKCSAAEIELKKQQAMERRRRRRQVEHDNGALT